MPAVDKRSPFPQKVGFIKILRELMFLYAMDILFQGKFVGVLFSASSNCHTQVYVQFSHVMICDN
jgi:hypothetical protein